MFLAFIMRDVEDLKRGLMTKDLSNRIVVMGFVAMWMVTNIHYSFILGEENAAYVVVREILTKWAVPWFFIVSGALAARSLAKDCWRRFVTRKFRGLVVPYAIWMLVPLLVGVVNVNLWYLRSLISFMFFILIFDRVLPQRCHRLLVAVGMLVSVFGLNRLGVRFLIGTPTSPFYFVGGYLISEFLVERDVGQQVARHIWAIVLVGVFAVGLTWTRFALGFHGLTEMILRNIAVVAMIAALWLVVSRFDWSNVEIPLWMKAAFFVYCCHGPILTLIGRQGWSCPFGVYFFIAPIVFFGLAAIVRRVSPSAYSLLSGGR